MSANIKGMYFSKDLGDGSLMKVIRLRRPDDDVWALALQLQSGTKKANVFLETVDGECFVNELADALVDYLEDKAEIVIEEQEQAGEAFAMRKEEEKKKTVKS